MTNEKNAAFQYAKMNDGISQTEIVCDKSEITLQEAKELWNKYYIDAARHIKNGGTVEMVVWYPMYEKSYGENLQYISTDAESDGSRIWVVKKTFYPTNIINH